MGGLDRSLGVRPLGRQGRSLGVRPLYVGEDRADLWVLGLCMCIEGRQGRSLGVRPLYVGEDRADLWVLVEPSLLNNTVTACLDMIAC